MEVRPQPRVLVVGNLVLDRTAGGWAPGGPALYTARMAAALGARVLLRANVCPEFDRGVLSGLDLALLSAHRCARYENVYDDHGNRRQRLLDPGEPLPVADLPECDVLLLAPAFHELASPPPSPSAQVVAAALQGLLRASRPDGTVVPRTDASRAVRGFARPGWFVFFSEEDAVDPEGLARELAGQGAVVFLTRGWQGAERFRGSERSTFPAVPARKVVDPTGAGDCFAAAFLVTLVQTGDEARAIAAALVAGALAVEGEGLAGVPTSEELARRLQEVAA